MNYQLGLLHGFMLSAEHFISLLSRKSPEKTKTARKIIRTNQMKVYRWGSVVKQKQMPAGERNFYENGIRWS